MWALLVVVLLGWMGVANPLSLGLQGQITWELPASFSMENRISLGWDIGPGHYELSLGQSESGWDELSFVGKGKIGSIHLSSELSFDPSPPSFSFGKLELGGDLWGYSWQFVGKLEPGRYGAGLEIRGSKVLRGAGLYFNLWPYSYRLIDETFTFSRGYLSLKLPLNCCVSPLWLRMDWDKGGLRELATSFRLPEGLCGDDCPLSLGAAMILKVEEKQERLFPTLALRTPTGLFVFLSTDWDEETHLLRGVDLYGILLSWEGKNLCFQSITSFAEDKIDLVEDPYWEMVSLLWDVPSCCGHIYFGLKLFFGNGGLLGLGKLELKGEYKSTTEDKVYLTLSLPLGKPVILSVGWDCKAPSP